MSCVVPLLQPAMAECVPTEKSVLKEAGIYDFHTFVSMFLAKRIGEETRVVLMVPPDHWQEAYLPETAVLQIFACTEAMSRYWHMLKSRSGCCGAHVNIMAVYRNQLVKWAAKYSKTFLKWKWFDLVIRVMDEHSGRQTNEETFAMVMTEELSPMVNHVEQLLYISQDKDEGFSAAKVVGQVSSHCEGRRNLRSLLPKVQGC